MAFGKKCPYCGSSCLTATGYYQPLTCEDCGKQSEIYECPDDDEEEYKENK